MDCNGECSIDTPTSCEGTNCGTAVLDDCDVCTLGTTGVAFNQDVDCNKNGKRTQKLTDLGGRVDNTDTSPIATIARELYEESNGAFYYSTESGGKKYLNINDLKGVIRNDKYNQIYSMISKYFLCFVNLPNTINIDLEKSGTYETHDVIKRELKWISINDFLAKYNENKVHIRLCDKPIIAYLRSWE